MIAARRFLPLIVLTVSSFAQAKVDCSANGSSDLFACQLQAKGFRCSTEKNGEVCVISAVNNKTFNFRYSQPMAFLVPTGLTQPQNILLHIHGFKGVCEASDASPRDMQREFSLLDQMKNAGATRSVMVFPMSVGKCETFQNELVPRFSVFTRWSESLIHPTSLKWIISGHSGAGSVLSRALVANPTFSQKVDSVFLEDATYGMGYNVTLWNKIVANNPKIAIASVTRPRTATATGASILLAALDERRVSKSFSSTSIRHCQIPNKRDDGQMSFYENFLGSRLRILAKTEQISSRP